MIRKSGTLMPHLSVMVEGITSTFLTGLPTKSSDLIGIDVDHADWVALGGITIASDLPVLGNAIQIIKPKANGGTLEMTKEIRLGPVSRVITLTAVEYNNFTIQLAAMTTVLDETGITPGEMLPYVPFSGDTAPIRGWFQICWYDQDDVLVRREGLWAELRLAQALASGMGGAIAPQFSLTVFAAEFNFGEFLSRSDA
jgi:hypothetical protein